MREQELPPLTDALRLLRVHVEMEQLQDTQTHVESWRGPQASQLRAPCTRIRYAPRTGDANMRVSRKLLSFASVAIAMLLRPLWHVSHWYFATAIVALIVIGAVYVGND
jgi:hypothetical protein